MSIGEKIKQRRLELSMSQASLARNAEISPQRVYQYEKGLRVPKIETLLKLADALYCSPEDLADYESFPYLDFRPDLFSNYDELSKEDQDKVNTELIQSERNALVTARINIKNDLYLLNRQGLKKAVERVHELTEIPRYRNDTGSASSDGPEPPETAPTDNEVD